MNQQTQSGSSIPTVRVMVESDVLVVAELYAQLGYPVEIETFKSRFMKLQNTDDHAIFVAEFETGVVVGVVHVREEQSLHAGSVAEIAALVVDVEQRGNGIGRVLMEETESWAAKRNLSKVKLLSNVNREKAHDFYRRLAYSSNKSAHIFVKSNVHSS
jgi:GNAT superfamily N-acetyltransferase